ncbi:unnamed protein product [Strongylus vulgaris]|uniref:Uncharacterized protein n=1 Tax=Strongylus vulgaris TaxID=40348 RepID=A0A3P7I6J8_STRVU|nr:unnamed protein product [Strongylus vulgaris]
MFGRFRLGLRNENADHVAVDMGVTQQYNSCGDQQHSHQPKMVLTGRLSGTILQQRFRPLSPSSSSAVEDINC